MDIFLPGLIMGFREGLEAFLVVAIVLQYLKKSNNNRYTKNALSGAFAGIISSFIFGWGLFLISNKIDRLNETAKLWESAASIFALILITTFIYWMIKNGKNMLSDIENKVKVNLSKLGIFSITFVMIIREGAEIAIFTFAGKYTFSSIISGLGIALIFAILIYKSLIKINLKVLFNITLGYLILQAGFLLGYGVHEGLSAFKSLNMIPENSILLTKAFNLSGTVLNHKQGILGLPLFVIFGWYSKPEIIQFVLQYSYTIIMFILWRKEIKN